MTVDFVREGLALHIARHIEVLCATANPGPWRIVGANATDLALGIIRRWNDRSVDILATLLRASEFAPKSVIAKRAKCTRNTLDGFWSDTLANAAIMVYVGDATEPVKRKVFPRGVRISSPDGIRLVLRKEPLPYSVLRRVYEGNKPIAEAANENLSAIREQIEAHPDRAAAEREEQRIASEKRAQLTLIEGTKLAVAL